MDIPLPDQCGVTEEAVRTADPSPGPRCMQLSWGPLHSCPPAHLALGDKVKPQPRSWLASVSGHLREAPACAIWGLFSYVTLMPRDNTVWGSGGLVTQRGSRQVDRHHTLCTGLLWSMNCMVARGDVCSICRAGDIRQIIPISQTID